MAMTLAQAILGVQQKQPTIAGIMAVFVQNSTVLQKLRFETEKTDKVSWTRELALPTSASRALNAAFAASDPTLKDESENLKIYGTKFEADRALVEMGKAATIANAQIMQLKSVARTFSTDWFKGTGAGTGFSGLQVRILSGQTIASQAAVNGAVLSLSDLDTLIASCEGNDKVLWASLPVYLSIQKKVRTSANVNYLPNNFGQFVLTYNGIPIMLAGKTVAGDQILDFSETKGSSSVATSIYCTSFDGDGVVGTQTSQMHTIITDPNNVATNYDVEWINNYRVSVPDVAWRLEGIIAGDVVD